MIQRCKIPQTGSLLASFATGIAAAILAGCLDAADPVAADPGIVTDTLRNHAAHGELYLPVYDAPQRGLVLGHNSLLRQQYAEKYYIVGNGSVTGLLVRLGGRFANPANRAEFSVRSVAANGLPGGRLGGLSKPYAALDVSGGDYFVSFPVAVSVADSFFVSFDLGDYGHGGFEGDTIGLLACRPGCRDTSDLSVYGRNAVQRHNHNRADWRDFYYQNLTPLAIHFAIYPVGEGLSQRTSVLKAPLRPGEPGDVLFETSWLWASASHARFIAR
jgi:hypothetical protein